MSQEIATIVDAKREGLVKARVGDLTQGITPYLEQMRIDPAFFARCTATALSENEGLLECDQKSLRMALFKCAQRGMLPDGESAALVPFGKNVTLIPMVGGLLDMLRRNCPGIAVELDVVRVWDEFQYSRGLNPVLHHVPKPMPEGTEASSLDDHRTVAAAWAVVTLPPAGPGIAPLKESYAMYKPELDRVRRMSRAAGNAKGPWYKHMARMYEKTVLKACLRRLPTRNQLFAPGKLDPDFMEDSVERVHATIERPVAGLIPPAAERREI